MASVNALGAWFRYRMVDVICWCPANSWIALGDTPRMARCEHPGGAWAAFADQHR